MIVSDAAGGKSKKIGLVLDFFNSDILDGVQAYAEEHGLQLDARWSVRGDWTPRNPGWDGVIYSVVDNAQLRKRIEKWKISKVSLLNERGNGSVMPDFKKCGVLAVEELLDAGANSILNVIISNRELDFRFADGVSSMAKQVNVECSEMSISSKSLEIITETLMLKLAGESLPIGVALPHAGVMFGLQEKLLESGLRIPEDVSMVAIEKDIQRTHNLAMVPITTVKLDDWLRGFVSAEMLHKLLEDESLPAHHGVLIPPKGVMRRASTGHAEIPDRLVASALSYLRRNCLHPIDVSDIVSHVKASRRTVETRFKDTLGRGIHEELSRLRIEEAKRQINSKDKSITEIAEVCGFSSVHYFSAAFKRETGMSPKVYQKQMK